LYFPISPEICLKADWDGNNIEFKKVKKTKQITRINSRTIRHAETEVYASSLSDNLAVLHEKNKGYKFATLIDHLGPYHIVRKKLVKKA
jgi:hypothetical protein